jgi:hypothetical protein
VVFADSNVACTNSDFAGEGDSLTDASSATAAFKGSKTSSESKLEYLNSVLASFMEGLQARFAVREFNGIKSHVAVFVVDDLSVVSTNLCGDYASLSVNDTFHF